MSVDLDFSEVSPQIESKLPKSLMKSFTPWSRSPEQVSIDVLRKQRNGLELGQATKTKIFSQRMKRKLMNSDPKIRERRLSVLEKKKINEENEQKVENFPQML